MKNLLTSMIALTGATASLILASVSITQAAPQAAASKPATGSALPAKKVAQTTVAAVPGPNFSASRFPGVSVRHVPRPAAKVSTQVKSGSHGGLVLRNPRRAANPRDGFIVDIAPESALQQTIKIAPPARKAAPKRAATRKSLP